CVSTRLVSSQPPASTRVRIPVASRESIGTSRAPRRTSMLSAITTSRFDSGGGLRKLPARSDPELRVCLAQVPLDGARADEQAGADLCIRQPVTGKAGDLPLLGRELETRCEGPLSHLLACGKQFDPGAFGERLHAYCDEQIVCRVELPARIDPATFASQPLAVHQMRARQLGAEPRSLKAFDRLAVEALRCAGFAHKRSRPSPDAQRPVAAGD